MAETIDRGHSGKRFVLRVVGPILLVAGIVLIVLSFSTFLSGFDDPQGAFEEGAPATAMGSFALGGILMVVGAALSWFGYFGAIARYQAGELAPVAADTVNYMGRGTQPGVRAFGQALGEGMASGKTRAVQALQCASCGELNDSDARFCDNCGRSLAR